MTGSAPFDFANPHSLALTVEAGHIDGLGHVNNAVYVQWCERAGWSHSQALGLDLADYERLDRAMAIRQAQYDYLLPARAGDRLLLATWLTGSDGRLNMTRRFQLLRGQDTLLRGRWELTCIEMSSGRPRRMPEQFVSAYQPAVTEVDSE